jgi:glycosyltransferase involved in cell wall biosynthesis
MLDRRRVLYMEDTSHLDRQRSLMLGISGSKGMQLIESAARRVQGLLKLPYFALFDSFRFFEALSRFLPQYDLCHEHNGLLSFGAALACRKRGIPYVLTFSADPLEELALLGRGLTGVHAAAAIQAARFTYRTAQKIICVSEPAKRRLVEGWKVPPEKIQVLPNGVDVELFSQPCDSRSVRQKLGVGEAPLIMFVGSFEPWHGVELLIESFIPVNRAYPKARLVLVGDGPVRNSLEKQVSNCGLSGSVLFTGLVPHRSVPEYLAAADIVTLPYPRLPKELWFSPLKLYEYMAAGKAIVATRAGQIAEVIRPGENGLLVEPGEVEGLTSSLLKLLGRPDLCLALGASAQWQAKQRHSWDHYIARLERVYEDALREKPR